MDAPRSSPSRCRSPNPTPHPTPHPNLALPPTQLTLALPFAVLFYFLNLLTIYVGFKEGIFIWFKDKPQPDADDEDAEVGGAGGRLAVRRSRESRPEDNTSRFTSVWGGWQAPGRMMDRLSAVRESHASSGPKSPGSPMKSPTKRAIRSPKSVPSPGQRRPSQIVARRGSILGPPTLSLAGANHVIAI